MRERIEKTLKPNQQKNKKGGTKRKREDKYSMPQNNQIKNLTWWWHSNIFFLEYFLGGSRFFSRLVHKDLLPGTVLPRLIMFRFTRVVAK